MWNIPNAYSSVMTFQFQCEYRLDVCKTVGGDNSGPEADGEDHDSQKGEANSDENRQDWVNEMIPPPGAVPEFCDQESSSDSGLEDMAKEDMEEFSDSFGEF